MLLIVRCDGQDRKQELSSLDTCCYSLYVFLVSSPLFGIGIQRLLCKSYRVATALVDEYKGQA